MPTTGSGKFPYPNSSAVPDVPADVLLLAQRVDKMASGWTVCADADARAALVTNGDAYEGLHVYQIDTKVEYIYLSTAWKIWEVPWTAYTPTWTNLTVGNSTQTFRYCVADGVCHVRGTFTLGSTGSVGSLPYFTLPLPANGLITGAPNGGADQTLGVMQLVDAATAAYVGQAVTKVVSSVVYADPRVFKADSTWVVPNNLAATTPFAWGTGDYFTVQMTYMPD